MPDSKYIHKSHLSHPRATSRKTDFSLFCGASVYNGITWSQGCSLVRFIVTDSSILASEAGFGWLSAGSAVDMSYAEIFIIKKIYIWICTKTVFFFTSIFIVIRIRRLDGIENEVEKRPGQHSAQPVYQLHEV